jgi:hypothetical protein
MKKLKSPRKPKVKGFEISMSVDGRVFKIFLPKKEKPQLKEILEKNSLKGISVSYKEVFESK